MPEGKKLDINLDAYNPENTPKNNINPLDNLKSSEYFGEAADFGKSKVYDDANISNVDLQTGDYKYIRSEKQSGLAQIGLGVLRIVGKAGVEAIKTPGYIYSLGEWGASNIAGKGEGLDKTLDNTYLNALESLDTNIKEGLPIYQSYKADKGGILDAISTTSFWTSEGADGVGYLIGMIAPGALLGKVGLAGKLSKLGVGAKTAKYAELGTQTLLNTSIEALAEAKGVADDLKKQGVDPEKIADAASNTFYANMGLLLVPNAIMNKNLLSRFSKDKSLLDKFRDASGKLVENPIAKKQFLKDYSKSIIGSSISEGLIEEGGQTSIENYEKNKALGKTDKGFIEGVTNEYLNTLTTKEGLKSIILGSVLGSLGGTYNTFRENKQEDKFQPILSDLIKKNFEGFSIDNDVYKRDSNGTIIINPKTNEPIIDTLKATQAVNNIVAESKDAALSDIAAFNNDKTLHDKIVNDQFTRFTMSFIQQGEAGLEVLNDKIDNASNTQTLINEKELNESKQGSFDENIYKQNLKRKAKELQKMYENTKSVVDNLGINKLEGNKELIPEYANRLINTIFQENSKQLFYANKVNELNTELAQLTFGLSAEIPQNKVIANKLQKEIKGLTNLFNQSKESYKALFDKKQQQKAFNDFVKNKENLDKLTKKGEDKTNKDLQKQIKSFVEKIKKGEKFENPEDLEFYQNNKDEIEKGLQVTQDDVDISNEKANIASKALELYETKDLKSFDNLYKVIKNSPFLSKEDKKGLLEHRKTLAPVDTDTSTQSATDLFTSVGVVVETTTLVNADKIQESVSDFINDNTSFNADNQLNLFQDTNILNQITILQKGINLRNNVVKMHLFNHYFDNNGSFKFKLNEEGLPIIDNSTELDIDEINNIQIGDTIQIVFTGISEEGEVQYKKDKQLSLKNPLVKPEDFDDEFLGILRNSKLIGFVSEPHTPRDTENKDISEELRQELIQYRKSVIDKLRKNEEVIETIKEKGNGNLYTKIKEKGETRRIDPNRVILDTIREKDLINGGSLLFVYSNGEQLVIPESNLTDKEKNDFNEILGDYKDYGKSGQVFQLVRDLKGSFSPIPIYSSLIDALTADKIIEVLGTYTNQTPLKTIQDGLQDYIYSSDYNEKANLFLNSTGGITTLFIDGNSYTLEDLQSAPRIKAFKGSLLTKKQNIAINKINNTKYQDSLKERNTLVSNVLEFHNEYFVQPYIEFTFNGESRENPIITKSEEQEIEANQKNTDVESKEDNSLEKRMKELDIDEDELLNSDDALSKTYDNSKLDRTNIDKWIKNNLPQLKISDVVDIADLKANVSDAYGLYKDLTIYLFEGAGNKTTYHEAFHGVFRNMLSLNEKKSLIKEVMIKYPEPTREDLDNLQADLKNKYTYQQLSYLYYEEKLADDFAQYSQVYNTRSFSQKIKDFFDKILRFFDLFTSNPSKIDELFNRVNTGKFKSKPTKKIDLKDVSIVNRDYEVFNDEYAYSKVLDQVFGTSIKSNLIQSLGNQFLSLYNKNSTKYSNNRPLLVYQEIFDIYNKFIKEDKHTKPEYVHAIKIIKNFPQLTKEINKYLGYRGILINEDIVIKQESFTEDTLDDTEVTKLRSQTTKGLGDWTSVSGLSSASTRLKLFLSSIPVLTEDKSVKKDIYGIEQFYNFNSLYYYIEENLTGLYTFQEQINVLKELDKPETNAVIHKLTNRDSNSTVEQFEALQNDFKTNFSKQQLIYSLVKFDTDSSTGKVTFRIIDANREGFEKETMTVWQNNLLDTTKDTISDVNTTGEVTTLGTTKAKELLKQWTNLINTKNELSYKVVDKILNKAGIEYSKNVLEDLIKINSNNFKQHITNVLKYYASDKEVRDKSNTLEANANKSLKELIKREAKASFKAYTSSFNNVEGKNIYTVQLPSYASRILAKIKSDNPNKFNNFLNEFKKDPFYKFNNLLNEFEEDTNFRKNQFALSYLDGLKDEKGESKGSKFTNMTPKDFMAMQLALFQNNKRAGISKYVYITPSDKTMSMLFDSKRYNVELNDDNRSIRLGSDIINNFYNVFLSEAHRIKHNLDIKNDILTNRDKSKYSLDELLQHYHFVNEVDENNNPRKDKQNWKFIQPYIQKQINSKLEEKDWEEISKLFNGQAYQFNYFNTDIEGLDEIIENSTLDNLEDNLNEIKDKVLIEIKGELDNEVSRVRKEMLEKGLISSTEVTTTNEQGKTKTITLYTNIALELQSNPNNLQETNNEVARLIASYATNSWLHNIEISNILNGDYALYKPNDLQKRTYQSQSMFTNNNWLNRFISTIVVKDVELNNNDKEVKKFKDKLLKQGFTEEETENIASEYTSINVTDAQVYITPELYKKICLSRGTWDDDMQLAYDIAEGIIAPDKIDKKALLKLNGIKPFYFGNRFDDKLGIQRYEQVKCAMIPLFKSYTDINPLLASKRTDMNNMGIEMMAHESSFKAAIGFRDSITSNNYLVIDLETDNFGIQVDNPEHLLDEENDSMRQLKMLILGSIDPSKDYNGRKGSDITKEILTLEAENIKESLIELSKKLDIKNNTEFIPFIKDMITKRGATNNVEELLNIVNGDFEYPLDGSLSTQIENMISSIFTNNVIKQSFEGGSAVQATSLGLKFKNLQEQQENLPEELRLIQQELNWIKPKSDTELEFAECVMPSWSSEFFDENGFLKDINSIPENIRQLIIYRIPTEGLHSMLPIKVVKFLPETMGNFILLPYEITKQFGADFDFDKVYFIRPEFDKNLQKIEYKEGKTNSRSARNNRILDNYLHLLTSRNNLNLLTKPSGFDKLLDIKKTYFKSYTKANFFSSRTQRDFKERNHIGIALKGQSALHVSGHSYGVLMPLNTESYTENGFLDTTKTINFNGKNSFKFDNIYDEEGNLIADELSSIMAAILDDIKNPILEPLGINRNTIDILATIIRSGFTMETAVKFISQPSIKQLSKLLDSNKNGIKEVGQGWNDSKSLINSFKSLLNEKWSNLSPELQNDPILVNLVDLSEKQTTDITTEELEYYLRDWTEIKDKNKTDKDWVKYYAFQIRILKNFTNISTVSKELVKINKFFGINKEIGPNIENIINKKQLLEEIEYNEIVKGFDITLIPSLEETYKTHEKALEFFEYYFPYSTPFYNNIKEYIVVNQTKKKITEIPIEDKILMNSFIRTYMDTESPQFEDIHYRFKTLFVDLPKLLKDIKLASNNDKEYKGIIYEKIKNNLFIQNIIPILDKRTGLSFIRLKGNRLDLQVKNNLIESFTALYNNKSTHELALNLIDYSFASNGFFMGIGKFNDLISPEILKKLGYMDYRKDLIKDLNADNVDANSYKVRLADQFIRNFPKSFTKVFDSEMFIEDFSKGAPNIITTSKDLITGNQRENDIILTDEKDHIALAKYIRVYDKVNKKALMYKNIDGTTQYTFITSLGKKGYMIEINPKEDIIKSFLKENNTLKSPNLEPNQEMDSIEQPELESGEYQPPIEDMQTASDLLNNINNNEPSKEDDENLPEDDVKPC